MIMEKTHSRNCPSADKELERFISGLPVETSHHRAGDNPIRCGYGLQGVCCRLCANGPCRVTPKMPKGICGADADTMVARNLLRAIASGSACYIHVMENTARNLKAMGEARAILKGSGALDRVSGMLDIRGRDRHDTAAKIAEAVLEDLHRPRHDKMRLTEKMAYPPRYARWKEIGILPGGAKSEVFDGVVKSSTNLNSDPVDMIMNCLTLGISTGIYGLTLVNLLNDIMLGEPEIRPAGVGFKTIDPECVNIMITGHQHSSFTHLQDRLIHPDVVTRAKKAGAKGFRLVGCTCVGQDLQLRGAHYREVFTGHAGNNFTSEAVLATGAIDLVVSEFNCTLPGLEPVAEAMRVKMICIDDVAKKSMAEYIRYRYEDRDEVSEKIIAAALSSYSSRRESVKINLPAGHGNDDTLTGVSEVSLKKFLGGNWQPLIDLIASGDIRGVAGVVGCSSMVSGGHDVLTVDVVRELIRRNIIVLTAGCSSGGLENVGLMRPEAADLAGPSLRTTCKKLGIPPVLNFGPCLAIGRLELVATELAECLKIDLPKLPLALSAPQWLEEQALADGFYGLALGLPLHLGKPPFVTGSSVAVELLSSKLPEITGGQLLLHENAAGAAAAMDGIIREKRLALGLS
ncbi:MAG: anaerobic carbon-monoxide dehydrogenase catalytic subunit [Planctomycetota bacterium]|jgi:carbon-monoxide dehydrogenase catalytic subunit|nr:anaerobic carbon-monoxide dehydrogenase catalytic subunit [Planctomycetota bacterium]